MNVRTLAIPLLGVALAACSGSTKKAAAPPTLKDYLPTVTTSNGETAVMVCTAMPMASSGPDFEATPPGAVLPGGSSYWGLSGDFAFDQIYVAIDGMDCYWRIDVTPVTDTTLVVTVGQRAPATFGLVLGLSSDGAAGPRHTEPVALTSVGTGKVQVSVSWDQPSDVDLHLVEPGGLEIYYGYSPSPSGGTLDLDSNPACSIDNVDNENITYGMNEPPSGTYTVRVDYFDGCSVTQTNYTVTVTVRGVVQTFTGSFTGDGDLGDAGSGTTITTFTY